MKLDNRAFENKINRISIVLLWVLVIGMPLHTMLFDRILGGTVLSLGGLINLWRDVIILFLFACTVCLRFKATFLNPFGIGMTFLFGVLGEFWLLSWAPFILKTNILRIYVIPLLMVFIMRALPMKRKQFDDLVYALFLQGVFISLFGLFQVFILGESFLTAIGYGTDGVLHYSFYIGGFHGSQRMVGTFASPNNCALYLAQVFAVCFINRNTIIRRKKYIWVGFPIIALGLVATFSRSSWVSLFVLFAAYFLICRPNIRRFLTWRNAAICQSIILAILLGDLILLGGRISDMILSSIDGVVSFSDASFMKHLEDLFTPIWKIITNPLGFGFGTSGPIALATLGRRYTRLVESSVWLVGYDLGIIGMIAYYLPYVYTVRGIFNKKNIAVQTAGYLTLVCLVIFCILPLHQNIESTFLVFLFMGMAQNKYLAQENPEQ